MLMRLLDSVILIDHLNNISEATRVLAELNPEETAVSGIRRAEILSGVEDQERWSVKALLDSYTLLTIDKPVADRAAELRKAH